MSFRKLPNIIITGTPGCGKTSHAATLCQQVSGLKHISVSDFAKENNCLDGYDKVRESAIVDEDKLLDALEPFLEKGGVVVDWHVCEVFPERLIDLVVVLRCDNSILYDRLSKRGYKDNKIQENLDVEIMEVIVQEAKDSYKKEIVVELRSDNVEDMDTNVDRIQQWSEIWLKDHPEGVTNVLEVDSDADDSDNSD